MKLDGPYTVLFARFVVPLADPNISKFLSKVILPFDEPKPNALENIALTIVICVVADVT